MAIFFRIALAVSLTILSTANADDRHAQVVSLSWQPYADPALRGQGATTAVVKAAFAAAGYAVDVDFYPWARAIHLSESENNYAGIFPVYYSAERMQRLNCSNPIGHGPLGFAERDGARVTWSTLNDLARYKIGVVRNYVNTQAFDDLVAAQRINVDLASNDAQNLQKLTN